MHKPRIPALECTPQECNALQKPAVLQIVPGDANDTYQSCLPIQFFRLSITATALARDSITI